MIPINNNFPSQDKAIPKKLLWEHVQDEDFWVHRPKAGSRPGPNRSAPPRRGLEDLEGQEDQGEHEQQMDVAVQQQIIVEAHGPNHQKQHRESDHG
jgi:hypothetical protein